MSLFYKENIIDHYKYPRNKGVLENYDISVSEINTSCGDKVTFFILLEINPKTGKKEKIKKITFDGEGCAISTSVASMLTEELRGKTLENIKSNLSKEYILELLGIEVNPSRLKCALLSLEALRKIK